MTGYGRAARAARGFFALFSFIGRRKIKIVLGNIKDDAIPTIFADQGSIDSQQNLLPGA